VSNQVYANNMEVSCKAAAGKSICAFPDVCFTPPLTPATPPGVPIPYPNTGMASDCTDGSRTVKISGQEVMLKNKSYFKKSIGDEAGCAPKKGMVTSVNMGKVYFNMWSMDVKVESENVVRNLDLTTHNHGSSICNTPPVPYADRMAMILESGGDCKDEIIEINRACKAKDGKNPKNYTCPKAEEDALAKLKAEREKIPFTDLEARRKFRQRYSKAIQDYAKAINGNACQKALRCALVPFRSSGENSCCAHQTPDHLILGSSFFKNKKQGIVFKNCDNYKYEAAPCMCAEGGATQATHGLLGLYRNQWMKNNKGKLDPWTVEKAAKCGAFAANKVNPQCSKGCIEAQLLKQHKNIGMPASTRIRRVQDRQRPQTIAMLNKFYVDLKRLGIISS
jgi:hypothetical protein